MMVTYHVCLHAATQKHLFLRLVLLPGDGDPLKGVRLDVGGHVDASEHLAVSNRTPLRFTFYGGCKGYSVFSLRVPRDLLGVNHSQPRGPVRPTEAREIDKSLLETCATAESSLVAPSRGFDQQFLKWTKNVDSSGGDGPYLQELVRHVAAGRGQR